MANGNSSKRAEIPVYSFPKHARLEETTSIYSPHVLILEGIFALYDPRVLELLDMKVWRHPKHDVVRTNADYQIFCEADGDTCLSRRSKKIVALNASLADQHSSIARCIRTWTRY